MVVCLWAGQRDGASLADRGEEVRALAAGGDGSPSTRPLPAFGAGADAQAQGKEETFYAATFSAVDEVGRRWGHCARQAGWGLNSQIHALGDGAEWIRSQTREVFGRQANFLCDFFHVSEYLGAAAGSCRADAPDRWRRTQQARLKRGAWRKVLATLVEHLEPPATLEEEAPVRLGHRYLTNRTDCLDYPRALQLGLPIGSGLIESGHRHVLQARRKKPERLG